jgi:hypothetical protein
MQEQVAVIVERMNRAYAAIYGTQSSETRKKAEKEFYKCHDWLRERGIKFRQTPEGRWILDGETTKSDNA